MLKRQMSNAGKSKVLNINVQPNSNPSQTIEIRKFGVRDLTAYTQKIDKNIKIFKEAIAKEVTEKARVQVMIKSLKADIKEARILKKKMSGKI